VGSLFLIVYLLTLILASSLTNIYIPQNNHTILILLLETPVNITGGLIIISRSLKFYQDEKNKGKTIKDRKSLYTFLAMILMFVVCMFLYQRLDAKVMMQFLVFELVVLGFLAYVYFNAKKTA
jgi:cell division protein FtsW (lipid II flippase)